MAYSADTDLLTGSIPTPDYLSPAKFVSDAADEIDSKLGFIYETPIVLEEADPATRPARLLLKRINNFLATGRLLMAVASPEEDDRVHAYASRLINEANLSLGMIAKGEIDLAEVGAVKLPAADGPEMRPLVKYGDAESNVEAFYDRVANPDYHFFTENGLPIGFGK